MPRRTAATRAPTPAGVTPRVLLAGDRAAGAYQPAFLRTEGFALVDAEEHRARRREPAAGAVAPTDRGIGDLAVAGLAPQLADGLDEQEHAPHARMARRQTSAVGVGR